LTIGFKTFSTPHCRSAELYVIPKRVPVHSVIIAIRSRDAYVMYCWLRSFPVSPHMASRCRCRP
jgi:hypothetical protein